MTICHDKDIADAWWEQDHDTKDEIEKTFHKLHRYSDDNISIISSSYPPNHHIYFPGKLVIYTYEYSSSFFMLFCFTTINLIKFDLKSTVLPFSVKYPIISLYSHLIRFWLADIIYILHKDVHI